MRVGQRRDGLRRAHHRLVLTVGVHTVGGLGAVGNPRTGVEVDHRFVPAGHVALPVTDILEAPSPADRQCGQEVEADQSHAGDGHRLTRGQGVVEVLDRVGAEVPLAGPARGGVLVPRVAGGEDDVVHTERRAVVQHHGLPTGHRGDVDGGGVVPLHLHVGGGVGHQGLVEPHQVLPHQPTGQVVGGLDRPALGADATLVPDPPVATLDRPLEEPECIGQLFWSLRRGIQRQLPAGVIEDEIVRLTLGIDPSTEGAGLDHMHSDRGFHPAGTSHRPLQHTDSPGPQTHDGQVRRAQSTERRVPVTDRRVRQWARFDHGYCCPFSHHCSKNMLTGSFPRLPVHQPG